MFFVKRGSAALISMTTFFLTMYLRHGRAGTTNLMTTTTQMYEPGEISHAPVVVYNAVSSMSII